MRVYEKHSSGESMNNEKQVPETLIQCRNRYNPPVQRFITCGQFGKLDCTNGGCWRCMEMTPYQWHMCSDKSWVRGLLSPLSRTHANSREEAIKFIENYKSKHPLGNERRILQSEKEL